MEPRAHRSVLAHATVLGPLLCAHPDRDVARLGADRHASEHAHVIE